MAGGNRKTTRAKQPITRHPLFPAIVALWFGALFGLGSVAIRVTLLEEAVVASGIDLIVPAAAPPLGMTARILLALLMASFGSLLGYALGSRIARPRVEVVQRRRTSLKVEEPPLPRRADRFTAGQDEARKPLSAFEELDQDGRIEPTPAPAAPAHLGSRRRALTVAEPDGPDYARDNAPLPGSDYLSQPTPGAVAEPDDVLDLCEMLTDDQPAFAPAAPCETISEESSVSDDEQLDPAPSHEPQNFAPGPVDEVPPTPRRFDRIEPLDPVAAPVAADGEASPEAADDRNLPPRTFARRFATPEAAEANGQDFGFAAPPAAAAAEPPLAAVAPAPTPAPAPAAPLWSAASARSDAVSAADQLRAAPLDSLSQVELIERLALSLQQRREAEAAAQPSPAAAVAEVPQGFAQPPAGELPRFGFEPKTPVELDLPPALPATMTATAPAPALAVAPAPTPAASLPAAMRPLDLGSDADDEDDEGSASLLPRFPFAGSTPAPAAEAAQPLADRLAASPDADPDADEDDGEEAPADESFSSLLDLGRIPMRQPLVRIEEPADASDEIEPVVVFPGHGSRPFAAPAPAAPELPAMAPPPGPRPFDAPNAAPSEAEAPAPAPAAGAAAASRQDPEETERALRAALATLQRMSGAA